MNMHAKTQHVHARIDQFTQDFRTLFKEAVESTREEIKAQERQEAADRLYGPNSTLSNFQTLTVTKENARFVSKVFKLMDTLDGVKGTDTKTIYSRGKEHGFTEEESMCVYNMSRYAKALNNLSAQKEEMVELILAED